MSDSNPTSLSMLDVDPWTVPLEDIDVSQNELWRHDGSDRFSSGYVERRRYTSVPRVAADLTGP